MEPRPFGRSQANSVKGGLERRQLRRTLPKRQDDDGSGLSGDPPVRSSELYSNMYDNPQEPTVTSNFNRGGFDSDGANGSSSSQSGNRFASDNANGRFSQPPMFTPGLNSAATTLLVNLVPSPTAALSPNVQSDGALLSATALSAPTGAVEPGDQGSSTTSSGTGDLAAPTSSSESDASRRGPSHTIGAARVVGVALGFVGLLALIVAICLLLRARQRRAAAGAYRDKGLPPVPQDDVRRSRGFSNEKDGTATSSRPSMLPWGSRRSSEGETHGDDQGSRWSKFLLPRPAFDSNLFDTVRRSLRTIPEMQEEEEERLRTSHSVSSMPSVTSSLRMSRLGTPVDTLRPTFQNKGPLFSSTRGSIMVIKRESLTSMQTDLQAGTAQGQGQGRAQNGSPSGMVVPQNGKGKRRSSVRRGLMRPKSAVLVIEAEDVSPAPSRNPSQHGRAPTIVSRPRTSNGYDYSTAREDSSSSMERPHTSGTIRAEVSDATLSPIVSRPSDTASGSGRRPGSSTHSTGGTSPDNGSRYASLSSPASRFSRYSDAGDRTTQDRASSGYAYPSSDFAFTPWEFDDEPVPPLPTSARASSSARASGRASRGRSTRTASDGLGIEFDPEPEPPLPSAEPGRTSF